MWIILLARHCQTPGSLVDIEEIGIGKRMEIQIWGEYFGRRDKGCLALAWGQAWWRV